MGTEFDIKRSISAYLNSTTKTAPLAVFRILFGLLMLFSIIRFWYYGWIETLYILPQFHFKFSGFEFIQVPGQWTYGLYFLCGLSALCVAAGYRFRLAIVCFFLSFTYIELMDKTYYLNHYYFISVLSFILIFLPAHSYFSLDAKRLKREALLIPRWNIDILKLILAIVYIYAGLAKLNDDWLFRAMPLAIWLPTKFDIPFLGSLLDERWMHYLFSWGGAFYDLFVVFFLLWRRTRIAAFVAVIVFHILTRVLFPIGMFPYIMIATTTIFFSVEFHERIITFFSKIIRQQPKKESNSLPYIPDFFDKTSKSILAIFIVIQLLMPARFLLNSENIYWTERGYRFSWRVMLMEKTGYANFKIVDGQTGKRFYVRNEDFLTPLQQKQMSTQGDFILDYAQFLGNHFESQGHQNIEVYVESYAALNGRSSQEYIHSDIDLLTIDYTTLCDHYIHEINE